MYYYENNSDRESILTRDFIFQHIRSFQGRLGITHHDKVIIEFKKSRYGKKGDVDIAILKSPNTADEYIIGIEVKVAHYTKTGDWKSYKRDKHNKQIDRLIKEGWDFVYLFDFLVTEEAPGWLHPQSFETFENYDKFVRSEAAGHYVFQFNPVAGRPQIDAGSVSFRLIRNAKENTTPGVRSAIISAIKSMDLKDTYISIDE